jgi:hypothetical protein
MNRRNTAAPESDAYHPAQIGGWVSQSGLTGLIPSALGLTPAEIG